MLVNNTLPETISGLANFYRSRRQESNLWKDSYRSFNGTFECCFLYLSIGYALIYLVGYDIWRSYKSKKCTRREKRE